MTKHHILFILLFSISTVCYSQTKNDGLRDRIVGTWEPLANGDVNFDCRNCLVYIKSDSITYYRNGKFEYSNPIRFVFSGDTKKFLQDDNTYGFSKDRILEYDAKKKDTLIYNIKSVDYKYLRVNSKNKDLIFYRVE